jgi:hypothetical protein
MANIGIVPGGSTTLASSAEESILVMQRMLFCSNQEALLGSEDTRKLIRSLAKSYGLELDNMEIGDLPNVVKCAASQALVLSYRICKSFGIDEATFREKVETVIAVENEMFYDLELN